MCPGMCGRKGQLPQVRGPGDQCCHFTGFVSLLGPCLHCWLDTNTSPG
jgi:hypothetical protein